MIACDKRTPPAPPVVTPETETINGSERIGWDQPAADTVELAGIGYAIYVDGARTELAGVTCASTSTAAGFACTARLPVLASGAHSLEIASFVTDGALLESTRSAALRVIVVAQTTAAATAPLIRGGLGVTGTIVAHGLDAPVDLAFAPDGRLFVAERGGRIRIVRPPSMSPAGLVAEPAIALAGTAGQGVEIVAVAIDPQFSRTHHVYAIYTAPSRGRAAFTLARFREVSDTLGDQAVLLDQIPASRAPSAALRVGPDGMLYAAFDDGGEPRRRVDAASFNGKVLRVNTDGTTPADAAGGTPVYAAGYGSPLALDWDPSTRTLWVADRAAAAAPFAFYRGALLPDWEGRMVSADVLFDRGRSPGAGPIAIGPDGAIYFGTADAVGRVAPAVVNR
jgi:hypothetical protein